MFLLSSNVKDLLRGKEYLETFVTSLATEKANLPPHKKQLKKLIVISLSMNSASLVARIITKPTKEK